MKDIKKELLKIAQENVDKKLKKEQEKMEKQIEKEIEDVKFILELIERKMLYKKIGDNRQPKEYRLITKEIFFEDYTKERQYDWQAKLKIKDNEYWDSENYNLKIEVNGERYYHIGYIIVDFEEELRKKKERIRYITEGLRDLEKEFEELKNQEKNIKGFIEDYNATNELLNKED